jgi:membrane associated rhomboid family serine protease
MVLVPLEVEDSDSNCRPYVTLGILAVNIAVFCIFQGFGGNREFTSGLVLAPSEFWSGQDTPPPTPVPLWMTLVTSMFLHGSLMHLVGNMIFLWIFGPVVESSLGRLGFFVLYILSGIFAGLTYATVNVFGGLPVLGASGAVAGVLGALTSLHPSRKVAALLFGVFTVVVPCFVAVGIFEIVSDVLPAFLGSKPDVAISAHIGGFAFGFCCAPFVSRWKYRNCKKDIHSSVDEALLAGRPVH